MVLSEYEIELINKINSIKTIREANLYFECRTTPLGVADQKALFIFLDKVGELVVLPDPETIKGICSRILHKPNRLGLANPDVYKNCVKFPNPLIGYRSWSWGQDQYQKDNRLYSMYGHTETPRQVTIAHRRSVWEKGSNQAVCQTPWQDQIRDIIPHQSHACGFNAFYDFEVAKKFLFEQQNWNRNHNKRLAVGNRFVLGACAGAGKAQLHELGWRSEKASVVALLHPIVCSIETQRKAEACSDYYQIPLFHLAEDLQSFVHTLGEQNE